MDRERDSHATPTTPQRIAGRYLIEDTLGQGAVGSVYRVHDTRRDVHIALKRVRLDGNSSRGARQRSLLEREFHTLTQLRHPRIIEVYDYGLDDDGPYYTMELLDGDDLRNRGRMEWRRVCALLCDVASSLAILHSRGLIHRDVSARNVRCTAEGRAKLIDFGAMMPMGLAKDVVGTPPFVAPEALQLQVLDARADLFALGALAYFMLTGRNAFPARKLAELRDVWRTTPSAPIRLAKETPPALSQLIMQLLALDRGARPDTAAEVMQRLSTIAELPIDEHAAVSRSYLSTPALVGRERPLLALRRRVLSLARGEGGTLLIEGAAGSGRSRLLDACVLEAKLVGATVVRADASDAVSGELGVARALGEQLTHAFPERARAIGRLQADVLGAAIPALASIPPEGAPAKLPERGRLLRELRDFVVELSRGQRLLIAVDDIDQIDELSAAWLAALAHKIGKHSIVIAATTCKATEVTSSTLEVLRDAATRIPAEPLDAPQTEALLKSVFGDVANLDLVTGRIFALAQGSPRTTMELAQHLVDRKLARYSGGAWSLPDTLDEADLPRDLLASLAARLLALSRSARTLSEALAVIDGDDVALDEYGALCGLSSPAEVFVALDELVASRIVIAEGERYRFAQRGYLAVMRDLTEPQHRMQFHERAASLLLSRGQRKLRVAQHLLHGGREREAVALLCELDDSGVLTSVSIALLEEALLASERLACPLKQRMSLRNALLNHAPMRSAVNVFHKHLPQAFARLLQDSGLQDYRELEGKVPEAERLAAALAATQQRYDQTPEDERGLPIIDAIRELSRFSTSCCSVGLQTFDLDFIESLPSLAPLEPLSPALSVMSQVMEATRVTLCGRTIAARTIYERALARIDEPDRGGFDDMYHRRVRVGLHYLLGLVEASMGMESAERHAVVCDGDPEYRVNAWRMRVALQLNQGNPEEARRSQRRAELLQLHETGVQRYVGTSAGFELLGNVLAADLLGIKRATDVVAVFADRYPGWRALHTLGVAHYRALQGDFSGALDALEPAYEQAPPGRHPYCAHVAGAQITWLSEIGEHARAVAVGREHVATCERLQIEALGRWVHIALALALARAGEHQEAVTRAQSVIASSELLGISALPLGALYEARARIALLMDDEASFQVAIDRCAQEYKKGNSSALSAKLSRLLDEARKVEVLLSEPPPSASALVEQHQTATEGHTVQSLMFECTDDRDRARCALTLLLNGSTSQVAHLYGVRENGIVCLGSLPEAADDPALRAWLEATLHAEVSSAEITETAAGGGVHVEAEAGSGRFTDGAGRNFEAMFIEQRDEDGVMIVAIVAMHVPFGLRTVPGKDLLSQIGDQLLEHGDVVGIRV